MTINRDIKRIVSALSSFLYLDGKSKTSARVGKWAEKLWSAHPWLKDTLRSSPDLETVRRRVHRQMVAREHEIRTRDIMVHPLEWIIIRDATRVVRNVMSKRCEQMASFSCLRCLFDIANGRLDALPQNLSAGFFEEMHRLFLAVSGRSGIYSNKVSALSRLKGREAAQARSQELDEFAKYSEGEMERYPSGLLEPVVRRRRKNSIRIMKLLKAGETEWNGWRWQLKNVVRDEASLGRLVKLSKAEIEGIRLAKKHGIPFGITPYYCALMDDDLSSKDDHAIRAQVIPTRFYVEKMIEHRKHGDHSADFMLEHDTSPIDLIVRRYPRIAIFKPFNTCAQICVYCQRNWEIKDVLCEGALAPKQKIDAALDWFEKHKGVKEILITGGDAFIMSDEMIDRLLERFSGMPHVERIRFGTRTPVVLPSRITPRLVSILRKYKNEPKLDICVVTHFEHAYEVTPEAMNAVKMLRMAGIAVYNQMVLTIENSRRFEAVATRAALKQIGVDPYYTFMMKGKGETDEMRVPVARALQEQKEEDRLMPGMLRTDETVYNVPGLGKNYIRAGQHHDVIMIMPDGARMLEFHPWEKQIALANTYVSGDIPIHDYLMRLASRGEDVSKYESVWYYY